MAERLVAIMGSGETAPTMVKVHRRLLERVECGGGVVPVPAVLLDTPYGFQENASIISARALDYFRDSVGHEIQVANWRSATDDVVTRERALAMVRSAGYVFAGPGSPTYALAQWSGSALPGLLADRLSGAGDGAGLCLTFASAAALTLGRLTVPVYEIYKVGATPEWRCGLDLLGSVGLPAVVIPHFDNAEGGNHDTRYCYLGERRLGFLEAEMPDELFVLGVDEHTACILDLVAGTMTVEGHGTVTVRRTGGRSSVFPTGSVATFSELISAASGSIAPPPVAASPSSSRESAPASQGLLADAERLHADFNSALARRDVDAAVAAVLALEAALVEWSRDTLQSDEANKARQLLRDMVVRLGDLARTGARDPQEVLAPFVEAVIEARNRARSARDFSTADALRDRLVDAGVEVHDTPEGSSWTLAGAGATGT